MTLVSVKHLQSFWVFSPPRAKHLRDKFSRLLTGPNLRTVVVVDVGALSGVSISKSVKGLGFVFSKEQAEKFGNPWATWQATEPDDGNNVSVVSVRCERGMALDNEVSWRGDEFFRAFPNAKILFFSPQPPQKFWETCPEWAFQQQRELSLCDGPSGRFFTRSHHPPLGKMQNLTSLLLQETSGVLSALVESNGVLGKLEKLTLNVVVERTEVAFTSRLGRHLPGLKKLVVSMSDAQSECAHFRRFLEETVPTAFHQLVAVEVGPWVKLRTCLVMADLLTEGGRGRHIFVPSVSRNPQLSAQDRQMLSKIQARAGYCVDYEVDNVLITSSFRVSPRSDD